MLTVERNGNHRYYLPESNDDFTKIIQMFKALPKGAPVGGDTETTGLDYYKDVVVGVCVAFLDKGWYHGVYLPVRHRDYDANLDKVRVFKFTNWLLHRFQSVWFNRSYDFSMLEKEDEVTIDNIVSHDVQIMCWEATYEKFPSLKKFYRQYCKKEIDSFAATMNASKRKEADEDDTSENEHDFSLTDPRLTFSYGAEDPVATLELFYKMQQLFPYIKNIYPLDNKVGEVVRQLTKNEVIVDYNVVKKYAEEQDRSLRDLQREIYDIAGYQFNIGSNRDKAEALSRFVTLTAKTKKGVFEVSIPVLKKIDHPLAQALIKYSEAFKFRNSYLKPFLKLEGSVVRFNYKTVEAPCLTEESTVYISGKGIKSVKFVEAGDLLKTQGEYGTKFTRVTEVSSQQTDKLVRVVLRGAPAFTATEWHPVWADNQWVAASDLKPGMKLTLGHKGCYLFQSQKYNDYYESGRVAALSNDVTCCMPFSAKEEEPSTEHLRRVAEWLAGILDAAACVEDNKVYVSLENDIHRRASYRKLQKLGMYVGLVSSIPGVWIIHPSEGLRELATTLRNKKLANEILALEGNTEVVVKRVTKAEPNTIYNISTESETYCADNLYHHNTARLASGTSRGNSFYSPMNVQSIPKEMENLYLHLDDTLGIAANDNPEGAIGTYETKAGLRKAFVAPEGYVFLTCDYAAEELRIVTNLSHEPVWAETINNGGDLHAATAIQIFGKVTKELRGYCKSINFGILYGMTKYSLAERIKKTIQEADMMLKKWHQKLARIDTWMKLQVKNARKTHFTQTYYGRMRTLDRYYNSSDPGMVGFADRSALNTPVQGPILGTSRVITDKGVFSIESLLQEGLITLGEQVQSRTKAWNGEKFCDFAVVRTEDDSIGKLLLKDGSQIFYGNTHLVAVVEQSEIVFKEARQLVPGDKVLKSLPSVVEWKEDENLSLLDYELMGRYFGDGVLYDNYIKLCCSLSEVDDMYDRFKSYSTGVKYFSLKSDAADFKEVSEALKGKGVIQPSSNRKGHSAYIHCKGEVVDKLLSLGLRGSTAKTKRIPQELVSVSLAQRAAFIKGFFGADGSKTQGQYDWHMCQEGILLDLQLLLRTCGIRSKVYSASDGTYKLTVTESQKFAELIGVAEKEQTFKKYGKINDSCNVPQFVRDRLLSTYGLYSTSRLTFDRSDKQRLSRAQALLSKIRNGKPVGVSAFNATCDDYGFPECKWDYYYSEVKSNESTDMVEDTYCLSLSDSSHQFEAEGMIHHNCIPESVMFELDDKVAKIGKDSIEQFDLKGKEVVLSHRGESPCYFIVASTGDFLFCNRTHLLFERKSKTRKAINCLWALESGTKVETSPLAKKKISLRNIFKSGNLKKLATLVKARKEITRQQAYDCFWAAWLRNESITVSHEIACNLRSLGSIAGFNVKLSDFTEEEATVYVTWRRKKRVKLTEALYKGILPVCSATVRYDAPVYEACGFLNHNTAADILRIKLCELYRRWETDKEFHDNVMIMWHVHDEVEFYVKKEYIARAKEIVEETMKVVHDNWLVPLVVEPGVGYSWGTAIDGKLGPDGKFISIPDAKWYEGMKPDFIVD